MTSPTAAKTEPPTDSATPNRVGASASTLLRISDLRIGFDTDAGHLSAVDGVSLDIPRGRTVALVGESGCGKSVTAMSVLRLLPQPTASLSGRIELLGETGESPVDILALPTHRLNTIRGRRIAMVFQDPMTSLNPVMTVGAQIVEVLRLHRRMTPKAARAESIDLLRRVGIAAPEARVDEYPHQMSGGMRQRVMIAMGLACRPELLIADEPTTALDVSVQAQILTLLRTLQRDTGMSLWIITHDLGVVAQTADYVYVMYAGRIVEHGPVATLLKDPLHPYTKALVRCAPRLTSDSARLETIPGAPPALSAMPTGCRFHPRCALTRQRAAEPQRTAIPLPDSADPNQRVLRRCVDSYDGERSGQPPLLEHQPGHFAACWECGQ